VPGDPGLRALLAPRAIAVLGASDDPVKIGGRPLAFLLRYRYAGKVAAAAELLVRLGEAARALAAAGVTEMDLNPVSVGTRGAGGTILDALLRVDLDAQR
jgi:hypothetical protein